MKTDTFNKRFFSFLSSATSPYHATFHIAKLLQKAGYKQITERKIPEATANQSLFQIRNDGAIIAFFISKNIKNGFRIIGSHTDSPCLKIKPKPFISNNKYLQLGVEVYGGALLNPWFDRELSISGRVTVLTRSNEIKSVLVDFKKAVGYIPSLAIHLDRNANKEKKINPQKDIIPLVGLGSQSPRYFSELLVSEIERDYPDIQCEKILDNDLFFYDNHFPSFVGFNNEYISSGRLDNLLSCFVSAQAMVNCGNDNNLMLIFNNHEEVGSTSSSGAQGNFAHSVIERLLPNNQDKYTCMDNSFFLSIDNAHASHPNFSEKHDAQHQIHLNYGPVLKINANQRYASDAASNSIFRILCDECDIPVQNFVMRNDMACGSTIGPLTSSKLGISTVDIGAASLAMHSCRELTGKKDPILLYRTVLHFLNRKKIPVINHVL